jgi:hypothetical protein
LLVGGGADVPVRKKSAARTRLVQASASHHLSLVVSTAVIASSMQRQASSYLLSSAYAFAKHDNRHGIKTVVTTRRGWQRLDGKSVGS